MAGKGNKIKKDGKMSVKRLMPVAGYVLIEPIEAQQKTESGIYLPDSATGEKPQRGVVLQTGGDEILESGGARKSPVKPGETVIYKKWGGNEVKIEGKEYLFTKFEDILAIER